MKTGEKNRARGRRRKTALRRKHTKARLRQSRGHQKF